MKLKHLFAMALIAIGVSAWAQTDVTSTYLTNAGFEGTYTVKGKPSNDRAIYEPEGWTVTRTNGEANDITGLKSSDLSWQTKFTPANSNGGSQTYWIRYRWGDKEVIKISQNATLPAGTYKISADGLKNSSKGTSVLSANGKSVSFTANAWETKYVEFTIYKETQVEIALTATQKEQAESIFGYDNVKIEYTEIPHPIYTEATNLDFSESVLSVNVRTAANDKTGTDVSGMQPVNGWIIPEQLNGAGDNHASGVFAYESSLFNGGAGYTAPAKATSESTGNTLAVLAVWGTTTQYIQPITFPAGSYTLTIPVYNKTGGTDAIPANLIGFVEGNGTTHYATTKQYAVNTWTTEKINFTLAEETSGYISLGYQAIGGKGSGSNPHLYIDGVTISGLDITPWNNAKAAAETALAKYADTYATIERTAVITAKSAADPTNVAELASMTEDLNTKVAAYIKKADNEILVEQKAGLVAAIARIKTEYPNSSDAVLNPDISKWTTSDYTVMNSNQHWSGANSYKYYEQSVAQWGESSWSLAAEQTVNLPAGKYAFVLTARASGDVTSKMTIDGQEVVLSTVGDVGYGVATNGECTYDMSKTYANNDAGRGWEYAYAEFTVTEAKDVTFRLESSTEKINNWVSIANPVLYYNDDAKSAMEKINAKAELSNTLQKVQEEKPAPTENIGDGVFQYSQANIDAYNQVFTDAQTVLDNAESTTQNYIDAKATLDNIQYPALNAPDAEQAYKMVQNSLSLNPETNTISSTESAVWFEAATGGYKIKSNTGLYIKYKGGNNWDMTTTDDVNSAEVFAVDYTATKGLTFKGNKGLYGGDNDTDGSTMFGNKDTNKYVFWSVSEVVVTEDYTALQTALAAKTLGFEIGEYAPYTNVEAAAAYNAAKAINQSVPNVKTVVDAVTDNLNNATWNAINTEEMNAVYDGTFANAENNGAPAGWTMSNNTLGGTQHSRAFVGDERLSEFGNASNSAFFIRFDGTNSSRGSMYFYGNTEGYTMPLKENTTYYVSVDFAGWGSTGKPLRLNVTGPAGFTATGVQANTSVQADTQNNAPQNHTIVFTTGPAGNYVINFQTPGADTNTHMAVVSNIVLKTAASANMTIPENKYATFCAPFDVTLPDGVVAYKAQMNQENTSVALTEADLNEKLLHAGTAVIVKNENGTAVNQDFYAKATFAGATCQTGSLVGMLTDTSISAGAYVLQTQGGVQKFFRVAANGYGDANRCYLVANTGARVITFDGDETAIETVKTATDEVVFDLAGRKVLNAQKGLYIVNGKKVIR